MAYNTKVLFVCSGNTCRSPMAQVIFQNLCRRHHRTGVLVRSAGFQADVGAGMSPEALNALQTYGEKLPAKPHRARQFTARMQRDYHYVVDLRHYPDPYGQGQTAYDYLCCLLQQEMQELYHQIFDCRSGVGGV